jgi:hypothetical protein
MEPTPVRIEEELGTELGVSARGPGEGHHGVRPQKFGNSSSFFWFVACADAHKFTQ